MDYSATYQNISLLSNIGENFKNIFKSTLFKLNKVGRIFKNFTC